MELGFQRKREEGRRPSEGEGAVKQDLDNGRCQFLPAKRPHTSWTLKLGGICVPLRPADQNFLRYSLCFAGVGGASR